VHAVFDESQVFDSTTFLGKESVGNILRSGSRTGCSKPVWNARTSAKSECDVTERRCR